MIINSMILNANQWETIVYIELHMAPNRMLCLCELVTAITHAAICLRVWLRSAVWQCYAQLAHTHTHRAPPSRIAWLALDSRIVASSYSRYSAIEYRLLEQSFSSLESKTLEGMRRSGRKKFKIIVVYTVCSHSERNICEDASRTASRVTCSLPSENRTERERTCTHAVAALDVPLQLTASVNRSL